MFRVVWKSGHLVTQNCKYWEKEFLSHNLGWLGLLALQGHPISWC